MEIKGEYLIGASREAVWQSLNDPEVLKACIPGCEELEKISDTEFDAKITAAIGSVRAKFNTKLLLEDLNPPQSYRLVGESKANVGFGRGSAVVVLDEHADGTRLKYDADFKVGGRIAQVGSRLVLGATRKTADEFFGAFSTALDPGAQRIEVEAERERRPVLPRTWIAVAAVVMALLIWWFLLR